MAENTQFEGKYNYSINIKLGESSIYYAVRTHDVLFSDHGVEGVDILLPGDKVTTQLSSNAKFYSVGRYSI